MAAPAADNKSLVGMRKQVCMVNQVLHVDCLKNIVKGPKKQGCAVKPVMLILPEDLSGPLFAVEPRTSMVVKPRRPLWFQEWSNVMKTWTGFQLIEHGYYQNWGAGIFGLVLSYNETILAMEPMTQH
jgi:hypothetical protein